MKKILLFIAFLTFWFGHAQAITIGATDYAHQELVNHVLINSDCASEANFNKPVGL